jgi:hypothetical protein
MSKWLTQVAAPLLGVAFALSGVLALGQQARAYLREQDRYRVAFRDIDCPAPSGMTREEFLGEVQYVAAWPDDVRLLDERLPPRLEKAFAAHPWVEEVRRVEITSDRHIRMDLLFRVPALTVPTQRKGDNAVEYRSVDRHGVLLPRSATDLSLRPCLVADVSAPSNRAGTVWVEARVQTAVRTAVFLKPYHEQLGDEQYKFAGEDLVVLARHGRVVWGHAPGDERTDEASADTKLRRWLDAPPTNAELRERDIRSLLPDADTRIAKSK